MHPWDDPRRAISAQEIRLERRRFAYEFAVSGFIKREQMNRHLADFERERRIRLSLDLFCREAEHVEELPVFTYPADWWQAFRARWFPLRWLRRHPVRMATVGGGKAKVQVEALFPELKAMGREHRIFYRPGHLELVE